MAHGLALKLEEMLQRNLVCRRDSFEIISEEDKLIKSWLTSSQGKFFRLEFFRLLRKTLIFVLSPSSLREPKRKELLKGVGTYFHKFSNMLKNNLDLRKPLMDVIIEPWRNHFFAWDELFQEKISIKDQKVQRYLACEPEEIVLARVHLFYHQGKEVAAMILAKCSFLYHSRIAKSLSNHDTLGNKQKPQSVVLATKYKGSASVDWYLLILKNYKSLPAIVHEINQLTCHEGVLLIQRLRRSRKNQGFIFTLLHILLMKELVQPSNYCCTKKIFSLWCIMHKEKESAALEISQAIKKLLAPYAPSSAHFYLFADTLWEQFGSSLITLYVELYVRGLTADLNHYEVAKYSNEQEDVTYLESHIALMFAKLSTLFIDFHEGAARECMFSAFSLKPTKERLYILQSLTHSILSTENEMKLNCSFTVNSTLQECKCDVRCDGSCKNIKDFCLEHPLLKKGISNVPFMLVKDLVTVLEGVRCFSFQYNIFDWRNNATDLGDYLKDFNLSKSWESDTEYASEGSNKSDTEDDSLVYESAVNESLANESPYISARVNDKSLNLSVKRKSVSDDKELFSLDIGANIEVGNEDNLNKRVKIDEQKVKHGVGDNIFNKISKPIKPFGTSMGMEDAIENVIRMTLDKSKQNSELLLSNNNFMNTSLNHVNDGTENLSLSSVNKHMPENQVYPYSLTSLGKRKNLSSDFKGPECSSFVKSSTENTNKYSANFISKSSSTNRVLTSPVSRESVISPAVKPHKRVITMQEQALKHLSQNKFISMKSVPVPTYCPKSNLSTSIDSNKKVPVYQSRVANMDSNNTFEQIRNVHNSTAQTSQYVSNKTTVQVLQKSGNSGSSDYSKTQFLSNASISTPHSMTSPVNVIKTKQTLAVQRSSFPPAAHCVSRSDSGYQFVDHSIGNTVVRKVAQSISCYQDNQLVHCDRSSVIQHTMQHTRENPTREVNDIDMPNQLSVSVNSNAAEQIRCVPKEDIANLPPFTVNVTDRTMSNSSVAVSASLVISRKPQPQTEISQPVSSNLTTVSSSDIITIPGILASPSVIVTPWEAQHKSHGELLYKKNVHAVNATSIDKRIYKNRPPYSKQVVLKQEPKAIGQIIPPDKNKSSQGLKGMVSASHISSSFATHPSLNQNQPNPSHVWSVVNKSSTQGIPQSTSSQPWYSEPYPKPYNSGNNLAPKSSGNLTTVEQSMSSLMKSFQPVKQSSNRKSFTTYSKQIHQSKDDLQNILSVPATVSHTLNSPVPSSTKSSVLSTVSSSSNLAAHPLLRKAIMHKDFTSVSFSNTQSDTTAKTLSTQCNPINNPTKPPNQYANMSQYSTSLIQEKSPVVFSAAHVDANLQYGHASKNFSNSCCSPSEINPCQNCSLPPIRVNLVQISSQKSEDRSAEQLSPSNNKMVCKGLTSTTICDSELSDDASDATGAMLSTIKENYVICQYCSHSFPASELKMHVLNSHSKDEINEKNEHFHAAISPKISPENDSSFKSLPDVVPEQVSLFQRESIQDNLPQARSFESPVGDQSIAEDVKNLDAIAFNACMDLINNDNELQKIVQEIEPYGQMENENNYLHFLPSTDSTDHFLNPNMCNEIQKTDVEAPLQDLDIASKGDGFNNYDVECDHPHLEAIKLNPEKSQGVFEFTEKDYEASKPAQKLIHPKAQIPYSENVNSSKTSNELTFSALAEMIKVSMTEDCNEELESAEPCAKDVEENISHNISSPENAGLAFWNCSYCPKKLRSNTSLRRHIRKLHPDVSYVEDFKCDFSPKLSDIGFPVDSSESNVQSTNEGLNMPMLDDISVNSAPVESSNSLTPVAYSNAKQNIAFPTTKFGPVLPKGRIKGIIKSPTSLCKFCGKMLTLVYMKKHILTQHSEVSVKGENSLSELNDDINKSSASQVDTSNFTAVSTLPDQDIDSSTCLSVSDALKRSSSYTIADVSNMSGESDKLSENTNVKFNFHVLELSNEAKVHSKIQNAVEEKDLLLSATEPSCNSPVVKTELDSNVKANVAYTKKGGFSVQRHICYLCSKGYAAVSSLNKHLKTFHQVSEIPRNTRKSKKFNKINETQNDIQNVERSGPLSSVISQNVVASNAEPVNASDNKDITTDFPEQLPHTSKISTPHLITFLKQKSGEKYKKPPLLNLNGSLLRTVLQSNFKSKQLEMQDSKGTKKAVHCQESDRIHHRIDLPSETPRNNEKLCSVQSTAVNCLHADVENDCLKVESLGIQSNPKISASVPSEISLQTQKVDDTNVQIPGAKTYTLPSASSKVKDHLSLNKILHGTDKNLQTHYTDLVNSRCHINSQNLSIQSNEISSVSEIISNVSKCHFGGTSNKDVSEKELYEDNSLKLLIPKNQQESSNVSNEKDNLQSIVPEFVAEQELNVEEESKCINTYEDSSLSFNKISEDLTVTNPEDSEAESVESKSEGLAEYEQQSIPLSSEKGSYKKCRLCHQNLSSIDSLSKHLKEVHDIPVLKKHISELYSLKHSKYSRESGKLSPPKLKLGTNESDSESCSDFEYSQVNLKVSDSTKPCTSINNEVLVNNSGILFSPSSECHANGKEKNFDYLPSNLRSAMQSRNIECKTQPKHPTLISSLFSVSNSDYQPKPETVTPSRKYKFRRRSFSESKSYFSKIKKSLPDSELIHLVSSNFDLQNNNCAKLKSVSLPNFQVALRCETTSHTELKQNKNDTSIKSVDFASHNKAKYPLKRTEVAEEHSSGENESLSSVTDCTELSKTSCDTISQNCSIQWDAITINSSFILSSSVSKLPPTQSADRNKMSRKFKLFEKFKSYKKQKRMKKRVKAKYFSCHRKFKSRKAFKPLILTLKEAAEISEFLKTHKQPRVKLIRLKEENCSNILLNKESCPAVNKYCMKEAVVKLDRNDFLKAYSSLINEKVMSGLSSNATQFDFLSMQNQEIQSINSPNNFCHGSNSADISHSKISTVHPNPPIESSDFSDTVDLDSDTASVDASQNVIREKCPVETDECCSVPLVKKCFVVLKRLSI